MPWSPTSWRERPGLHQPEYPDAAQLASVLAELRELPPLVSSFEVERLRAQLADAAEGRRFLLQGGDCAERFEDCRSPLIAAKLKILLQMGLVLSEAGGRPAILVGRIAGQYAKPRSAAFETIGEMSLPSYRGDLVNAASATPDDRLPDPRRLLKGYARAGLTVNFIRALLDGGFGDPGHPEWWRLDFARDPSKPHFREYERLVAQRRHRMALEGASLDERAAFFTSHEALLLSYEEAQTRQVPHKEGWWNLATHFPWLGARTGDPRGAHVEYLRGVENPIGVKIGPDQDPVALPELLDLLDPRRVPGRITLIHRLGADQVEARLPAIVAAVEQTRRRVLWSVDPLHGNTRLARVPLADGRTVTVKTRRFEEILAEVEASFEVHRRLGSILGGVHFELTGEDVTECLGGASGVGEVDLARAYRSPVDPRLNDEQSLEMALLVSRMVGRGCFGDQRSREYQFTPSAGRADPRS